MDGCVKSRSPRRSTLLDGATLAVDAGTGAAAGIACIGGTGGSVADSNGWKSPLGLQSPDNCTSTNK